MKMPRISLEELAWTGRSCMVGSRRRRHEGPQRDGNAQENLMQAEKT